jgi:hypothetical protein
MFRTGVDPITHRPTHQAAPNGKLWPRGFINGNPGNIDFRPTTKWQGQIGIEQRVQGRAFTPRFAVFTTAVWGIRAILRNLVTYQDQHDINTVRGVIDRWAPPTENDTGAYVAAVAKAVGRGPDEGLDLHTADDALPIARAIVRHELGDPRAFGLKDWYADEVWDEAATRAGLKRRAPKPVTQDRDVVGGAAALGLTGISAADALGLTKQYVPAGSITAQIIGVLAALVVGYLVVRALRRRQRDAT